MDDSLYNGWFLYIKIHVTIFLQISITSYKLENFLELLTLLHFGEEGWTKWLEGQRGERETFNFIAHFGINFIPCE